MIDERDEWLHEVGPDPAWQESFYFNWADPERQSFTLARTGSRFHARKTDGLVVSLRAGELELFYGQGDLDHYCRAYEHTGFRGGINWYRNIDRKAREHPAVGTRKLALPCLMLTAELDPALRPEYADGMPDLCSDLELHRVSAVGHWMQQEAPDAVGDHLLAWLERVVR